MHNNLIPIEKSKGNISNDDGRSNIDSDTVTIDMEATEGWGMQDKNASNIEKGKNETDFRETTASFIPHPYIIWVQFMGYWESPPEPQPVYKIEDPKARNAFVRKVFLIVLVMLLMTAGICIFIHQTAPVRKFFIRNALYIWIPAIIVTIGLTCILQCMPGARKAPCSYICLLLAVIASSIICTFVTLKTRTVLIYYVLGATVVVVLLCCMLACSSFDFTKFMLYIVMISTALLVIFVMFMVGKLAFGVQMKPLHIVLLIAMTLISMIAFAMELQMILGGRTVELAVNEHIIGAFMVYLSIIDIFLKLLMLANLFDR